MCNPFSSEWLGEFDCRVPVSRVTSCTFGGPELDTLFITTARWDMSEAELNENPQAGGLFKVKPGFKGLPDARFAG